VRATRARLVWSMVLGVAAVLFSSQIASASLHLMKIEQVIGGVSGNPFAQAIQLRMRQDGQNLVNGARVVVADSAGASAIVYALDANVANGLRGDRILLATAEFSNATNPPAVPDFIMSTPLPASYLAAGTVTYEGSGLHPEKQGLLILWRLSWGGANYTGSTMGELTNDDDGDFSPPFGGALPSGGVDALLYQGGPVAKSTTNAADYEVTAGAAVFTNNAGVTFSVAVPTTIGEEANSPFIERLRFAPTPFRESTLFQVRLPRDSFVRLLITDPAGRAVASFEEFRSAGPHSIPWDGRNQAGARVAPGVYLFRWTAAGETRTGRVVVLR